MTRAVLAVLLTALCAGGALAQAPYAWEWRKCEFWPDKPNLRTARLAKKERKSIFAASFAAYAADAVARQYGDSQDTEPVWEERIRLIDLDGDGAPEVVLMGEAGPEISGDGNNVVRLLRKEKTGGYEVLLDAVGNCVNVDRRDGSARPVLALYTHYSASNGHLDLFRFDADGALRIIGKYDVDWASPSSAFEGTPTLTATAHRAGHRDHLGE